MNDEANEQGNSDAKPAVLTSSSSDDGNNSSSEGSDAKPQAANYKDHSREPPPDASEDESHREPTFPMRLHMILSNPDFQDIVAFVSHGRSWRIIDQRQFEDRVIPLYFRHQRYSSFARQVNGWGFRRISRGTDYNSYYHEVCLRLILLGIVSA